ncbi:hypothetical protein HNQ92_000559 [Rhabdobacter roseus]|uniref:DUF6089 domain-containing protein n=1 Tax=Rhabdobacter roseus TaxID=1655419 RepID=A0A840TR16_9BACT|nr:DUF6089 family protein [Rhabdobacter roseus]MBB5282438.1 hypothetical protein [Rhabdobacter roseus]
MIQRILGRKYLRLMGVIGTCFFLGNAGCVYAQQIELGASVGAFNYKGDISPAFNPRFFRPGGSLFFRYNVSRSVSFRAEGLLGSITADDQYAKEAFQQARNLSFRTRISEVALLTEYNFLNYEDRRFAFNWTPYVFGGVGYMGFKPSPKTEGYPTRGLVIPFGVGVKYQIHRPWSVGLEFGTRKTFTDNLDNLGERLSTNRLEQGNPALKDMYYYLGLSLTYTFYRITCPE